MKQVCHHILLFTLLCLVAASCGSKPRAAKDGPENTDAKRLLQGLWIEEGSETAMFQMRGDTVYYADSTSAPAYFKVVGDTLYIGEGNSFYVEKQTEHVLWFRTFDGETLHLVKGNTADAAKVIPSKQQILDLKEVLKRDTIVFYGGRKYHIYIAINPTRYKVVRQTVNDDGIAVDDVYYDNIINLNIFKDGQKLFSRDFRKQNYASKVPAAILEQSILNSMEFGKVDANGFHLNVSVCIPDEASCYMIDQIVSFDGKTSIQLLEN